LRRSQPVEEKCRRELMLSRCPNDPSPLRLERGLATRLNARSKGGDVESSAYLACSASPSGTTVHQ